MYGQCKPWVLTTPSQFRPAPPPDPATGMQELRQAQKTPRSTYLAMYWAFSDAWNDHLERKLYETNLHLNAPRAARAYALLSVAAQDAVIACFDAKYAYWSIRPNQYDSTYVPVLAVTPPHPSYPSGHATASNARATVLSYLFPEDAHYFRAQAREAAQSRFDGGVHFRIDNEVGLQIGQQVGNEVVKRARQDGADAPPGLVQR